MPEFNEKPDWYETDFVLESGIPDDNYGNSWFTVKFHGNAEEALWLAKEKPEEGKKYYGHFTQTAKGKLRFKRDQVPEDEPKPSNTGGKSEPKKPDAFLRDATTVPIDMIKALLPYYDVQSLNDNSAQYADLMELAQKLTEDALTMVESIRSADKQEKEDESEESKERAI